MRLSVLFAALAVVVTIGCGVAAARPYQPFEGQSIIGGRIYGPQGAWCAYNNAGDRSETDCSFGTFAACNQEALLNRGYCTQNFAGSVRPVRARKGNRDRRRY